MKENLPPGFRFHPTDEELITYYLVHKVSDFSFTSRAVTDVDLNKSEPWDLPAKASMGEKEWYFFSLRDRKYPTGLRTNRATEAGYWKTTGKDKEIFRGGVLVGMKKTLVFYRGRAPTGEKTNWVMHEYRLENKHAFIPTKEEWVVCRIFQKSATVKKPQQTTSSQQSLDSPCDTNTVVNEFGHFDHLPNLNNIANSSTMMNNISLQNYTNENNLNMSMNSLLPSSLSLILLLLRPNPNPSSDFIPPMLQSQQQEDHENGDVEPGRDPLLIQNPDPDLHISLPPPPPSLLHVTFNQDYGCFASGTDRGFRIYNCDPFRELFRRDFDAGGGIGVVEMLFRCNILVLIGGGSDPQYPPNKVMIWDDHESRCIGELSFRSEVRGVRLRRDRIVVVLEQKIFVYNFVDLKLLHQIETIGNPKGLCEVSQGSGSFVLVCLGLQKGQVRVEHYASKRNKFIMAHDSRIACFTLAQDGQLLATASTKGTLVRIFNTSDGTLLQEVRRGADRAEIYSLAFSSTAQWLAVSSDKGTVHVFSLKSNLGNIGSDELDSYSNPNLAITSSTSSLSFIKGILPKYFSSEWSVAQFRLIEDSQYIVAFGHQKDTVVILSLDGSFYRCKFDPAAGGEMSQLEYHNFLKPEGAF